MDMQQKWRIAGVVCIVAAGAMAWFGPGLLQGGVRPGTLVLYWGVFLVFLLAAIACVILDLRYIRLEYAIGKRKAFEDTLGDEEFRKVLMAARAEAAAMRAKAQESEANERREDE